MKITNKMMLISIPSIMKLASQDISVTASFKLNKLRKLYAPILEIYSEKEKEIRDKNTVKDESGNPVPVLKDGQVVPGAIEVSVKYYEDMKQLDICENEFDIQPIKLEDIKNAHMTGEELEKIDWLIVE